MTGRPTKLTPETADKIIGFIRTGLTASDAITAAGIGESTFYGWKARGQEALEEAEKRETLKVDLLRAICKREGLPSSGNKQALLDRLLAADAVYVEFSESVKKAVAEREAYLLGVIQKAATRTTDPDWKAAAWILERTAPAKYSRRTVTQLMGKDDGPIKVENVRERVMQRLADIQERRLMVVEGGKGKEPEEGPEEPGEVAT